MPQQYQLFVLSINNFLILEQCLIEGLFPSTLWKPYSYDPIRLPPLYNTTSSFILFFTISFIKESNGSFNSASCNAISIVVEINPNFSPTSNRFPSKS